MNQVEPVFSPTEFEPLRSGANVGCLVIPFSMIWLIIMAIQVFDPKRQKEELGLPILAVIGFSTLSYIMATHFRCFVEADGRGVTVSSIFHRTFVPYESIENIYLLQSPKDKKIWRSYIQFENHGIHLVPLFPPHREAILARIEEHATASRSRRFEKRDAPPSELVLPATFDYRCARARLVKISALLVFSLASGIFLMYRAVLGIGWQFFDDRTRGLLLFFGCWMGFFYLVWFYGLLMEWCAFKNRLDESITISNEGIFWKKDSQTRFLAWSEMEMLETETLSFCTSLRRVRTANSTYEFAGLIGHNPGVTVHQIMDCIAEKSGLKWAISPATWRRIYGLTRDNGALRVSKNHRYSRFSCGIWLTAWLLPVTLECSAAPFDGHFESLWDFFSFPLGLAFYYPLAFLFLSRRVSIICDARGLTGRGLFGTRFLAWEEIESFGSAACDFVRAKNGQTLSIWLFPLPQMTPAKLELRAEIERLAVLAKGDWETKK